MYSCHVKRIPALIKHLKLLTNKVEFFKFQGKCFEISRQVFWNFNAQEAAINSSFQTKTGIVWFFLLNGGKWKWPLAKPRKLFEKFTMCTKRDICMYLITK